MWVKSQTTEGKPVVFHLGIPGFTKLPSKASQLARSMNSLVSTSPLGELPLTTVRGSAGSTTSIVVLLRGVDQDNFNLDDINALFIAQLR